jgi:hypothetical protein
MIKKVVNGGEGPGRIKSPFPPILHRDVGITSKRKHFTMSEQRSLHI